jgi:integrase
VALSDTAIRAARAQDKPVKLFDGGGLFLLVTPAGGKWWRLKYRYGGKEKLLSLGTYPEVPLASKKIRVGEKEVSIKGARELRDDARKLLASGADPSAERRRAKIETRLGEVNTFDAVADEWLAKKSAKLAKVTQDKIKAILRNDLRPWLGSRPVKEITAPELLMAIRRVESRGANELAHRALRIASQVFQYGIATSLVDRNPAVDIRGALEPVIATHHASITDPQEVGALLRAIDGYTGTLAVKCALRLAPMIFVRPGELRQAEWSEVDLDRGEWNLPASKMKMKQPHLVPLSTHAIAILRELHPLTGRGRYVFPSIRTGERPMSENTVNGALRRLGFASDEMVGHGFRAMARTILDEVLGIRVDYIEHQLAHAVKDPNGRAYNRTAHLAERKKMMQAWSDYLDKLKAGAVVIPLHGEQVA